MVLKIAIVKNEGMESSNDIQSDIKKQSTKLNPLPGLRSMNKWTRNSLMQHARLDVRFSLVVHLRCDVLFKLY